MVLLDRIELSTSSLPMTRSTTELQQQPGRPRSIFAGQARPMAGRPAPVKAIGLTRARFHCQSWDVSKTPSPAELERQQRLAEALRENLRKRKAQARETRAETTAKD